MNEVREIFLHIGYPKTATTTLQKNLFPKHSDLFCIRNQWREIEFIHDLFYSREVSFLKKKSQYRDELIELVENTGKKKYVFSEESLTSYSMFFREAPSPYIWTVDPVSVARKLKVAFLDTDVFDSVKIIITIRKQQDLLKSIYAQVYNLSYKRYRETKSFERFMEYSLYENSQGFVVDALCFNEIILEYEELFGKKNICILVFEKLKEDKAGFIDGLCDYLGIKSEEALRLLEGQKENVKNHGGYYLSDKRNMLEILAIYKKRMFGNKSFGLSESYIARFLKGINLSPKVIHDINILQKYEMELKKLYSSGNKSLSDRYELNLSKYGYYCD